MFNPYVGDTARIIPGVAFVPSFVTVNEPPLLMVITGALVDVL